MGLIGLFESSETPFSASFLLSGGSDLSLTAGFFFVFPICNFVLSAIFLSAQEETIKQLSWPLLEDPLMWTHPKANHCIRAWLQVTKDAETLSFLLRRTQIPDELWELKKKEYSSMARSLLAEVRSAAKRCRISSACGQA